MIRVSFFCLISVLFFSCSSSKTSSKSSVHKRKINTDSIATILRSDTIYLNTKIDSTLDHNIEKDTTVVLPHQKDSCLLLTLRNGNQLNIKKQIFKGSLIQFEHCGDTSMLKLPIRIDVTNVQSITRDNDTLFVNRYSEHKEALEKRKRVKSEQRTYDKLAKVAGIAFLATALSLVIAPPVFAIIGTANYLFMIYLLASKSTRKMSPKWKRRILTMFGIQTIFYLLALLILLIVLAVFI